MVQSALIGLADSGGGYALLALCLILVYRTTGVPNFAIAATGTAGAFIVSWLYTGGMNLVPACVLGIICGGLISTACGLIYIRWFFETSPAYRAGIAVAFLIAIPAITIQLFSNEPREIPTIVPGSGFTIDGVQLSGIDLAGIICAAALSVVITMTLNRSRRGLQLRAIAQGPVASELLGLPVKALSLAVWGTSGMIATVAILVIAPGLSSDVQTLSLLVVPALAATLVAGFRGYWLAFVAAIALGALEGLLSYSAVLYNYIDIVPLVIILGVLVWNQRKEVWNDAR